MKWVVFALLLLIAGCSGHTRAHVGTDPVTGEQVAYSTLFFKQARLVLSAPMRGAQRARLALWTPPVAVEGCEVELRLPSGTVAGGDVTVEIVRATFAPEAAGEPEPADRVVEFTLPLTALDQASQHEASLEACGEVFPSDAETQRALVEFRELTGDSGESD